MASAADPVNWKRNLFVAWLGCFLTGAAFSLVMPFLPLYVETLGVTDHQALNMYPVCCSASPSCFPLSPRRSGAPWPIDAAAN